MHSVGQVRVDIDLYYERLPALWRGIEKSRKQILPGTSRDPVSQKWERQGKEGER
jgi:hypothetical protein